MRLFVPADSTAVSIGADEVAAALAARAPDAEIVRTGSRGLYWLEPLVEVEHEGRRFGFGPLAPADVDGLLERLAAGQLDGPGAVGDVEQLLAGQGQERITLGRCGVVAPGSVADYERHGGLAGLRNALAMTPQAVVDAVSNSGLRGRGGAGFPTGTKWQTVHDTDDSPKFIVCNADEGDSGTFADRMLMEGDPLALIEGMLIAGVAVGAEQGYIYLRSEYPDALRVLRAALADAREHGVLGDDVLGSGKRFDIEIRVGAGAYICGEETSLLESLEGNRGMIRYKPPLPAIKGFFEKPTVVNNVITLATVPGVLVDNGESHRTLGTGQSLGTLTAQLCGNVARPGLYEIPFGMPLGTLINDLGGGSASGRPVRAVQVGGPLGAYFPVSKFDARLDYESFAEAGGMIGHGGVVVFDDTVDLYQQARFSMEFCAKESCGKCTPCRVGSTRGVEVIDRIHAGTDVESNIEVLDDLCETMASVSLCALGGLTPFPVRSALRYFPDDFHTAVREHVETAHE